MRSLKACRQSVLRAARPLGGLVAVLGAAVSVSAPAAAETELPAEVESLLEAEPLPPVAVGPRRRYVLLVHERGLLSLDQLAAPAIEIAGRRVNPRTAAGHAPIDYYALTLVDLETGQRSRVPLPDGATIGFPDWSPDGTKFAFTVRRSTGTELWVGDPRAARARAVADSLNASRGPPCTWAPDSRRLYCKQLAHAVGADEMAGAALGRYSQQGEYGQPVMLSSELIAGLLESQLMLVDSETGHRHAVGSPAAIESVHPAPGGDRLLVTRIHKPYPRVSGVDRVLRVTEVWDRFGDVVAVLPDESRAVTWNTAEPATLTWAERRDGNDHVVELAPPYASAASEVFELPNGFSGLRWLGDTGGAIVNDYDDAAGRTTMWHVDFSGPAEAERLTRYPSRSPRIPITRSNGRSGDAALVHAGAFYVHGETDSAQGRRAFLDRISIADGEAQRIWEGRATGYETLVDVLSADAAVLLTRHESSSEPPSYFVTASAGTTLWSLTPREHTAAPLADARRMRLSYERPDGVALGASLHLPPGYEGTERLPLVVWAYPRRFATAAEAAPAARVGDRYPGLERALRLFFVLRGYAVLDDVSMPIIGSRGEANDTFVEQVKANASAAIGAAEATGFVDGSRVAVAGHSYGAFMVANLLAHSSLFEAGAALSGAYNRTLTPFGFQTERRTLWEAPETYLAMSPILYSHRIEAPLLLVHGTLDDNAGTSPLQSTQFYEAIRGTGGEAGLLLLPWEGHSYRARESVMRTAAGLLDWFDRYVKDKPGIDLAGSEREVGAFLHDAPIDEADAAAPR